MKLTHHNPHRERQFPVLTRLDFSLHLMITAGLILLAAGIIITIIMTSPRTMEVAAGAARFFG